VKGMYDMVSDWIAFVYNCTYDWTGFSVY